MTVFIALILFSAISFLYYGITFFTTASMKAEFDRYGLSNFRKLTGVLQLMGGIGLLAGLHFTILLILASAGLFLLMLAGFAVRLKMKDGLLQSAPSFIFMLLNLYIFLQASGLGGYLYGHR